MSPSILGYFVKYFIFERSVPKLSNDTLIGSWNEIVIFLSIFNSNPPGTRVNEGSSPPTGLVRAVQRVTHDSPKKIKMN